MNPRTLHEVVRLQTIAHQLQLHPTGLMADFLKMNPQNKQYEPVSGRVLERNSDQYYSWNSCRSPWRLAVYYACALLTPLQGVRAVCFCLCMHEVFACCSELED